MGEPGETLRPQNYRLAKDVAAVKDNGLVDIISVIRRELCCATKNLTSSATDGGGRPANLGID